MLIEIKRGVGTIELPGRKNAGFSQLDYLKISVLGFGLAALWAAIHSLILPVRLLDFVPAAQKNTYLDLLILSGLFLAMLIQPITGALSDSSGFRWGRRRPFILVGVALVLLLLPGIGLAGSYAAVFLVYCLLQLGSNIVQGPYQGFIPDLVPEDRRGTASGWRGLLNLVGGVALIRLIAPQIDKYLAAHEIRGIWLSLGLLAAILLVMTLLTLLFVREPSSPERGRFSLRAAFARSYQVNVRDRPEFVVFLVASLFIFLGWGILTGHALYFLIDVIDLPGPASTAGNLLIVVAVTLLAAVYPAGWLCDRVGRKPLVVGSGLVGALGIALLYLSTFVIDSRLYLMVSGGLLGVCGGIWVSTQWALATDLVGAGEEARYLGLVNMSVAGAGALSRLMGPVIDYFNGLAANAGYGVMLLICFLSFVIGSLLLMRMKLRQA